LRTLEHLKLYHMIIIICIHVITKTARTTRT